jgi:DNA-binding MarR family transcriptional regulator
MEDMYLSVMNTTIRQSIQQVRPFSSEEEESFLTLARAWDVVAERGKEPIAAAGLSVPQYNVLRILRGAEPEGLQTYQVAERMVTRAPNITRLVDKLEAGSLLTRTRSTQDRRVVRVRITATGMQLVESLDAPVDASVKDAMRGLNAAELEALRRLLDRLREPLEQKRSQRPVSDRGAASDA